MNQLYNSTMIQKILFSAIFILLSVTLKADTQFKETFGLPGKFDEFASVCETADHGYLFFGNTSDSLDKSELFLVRTTINGTFLWSRTFDYPVNVFASKIISGDNGEITLMGYTYQDTLSYDDIFLIRTDSSGNIQWSNIYGGNDIDEASDMTSDSLGNLLIAGYTYSFGTALKSGFVIKTDNLGAVLWSKVYSQNINQEFSGITLTSDGGNFLTGFTQSFPGINIDGYMVKTDNAGNVQWSKRYGGSSVDILYKSWQDVDSTFYICGATGTNAVGGNLDGWLLKVSSDGNTNLINTTYGSVSIDRTYSLSPAFGNELILSGHSINSNGNLNALYLPVNKSDGTLTGTPLLAGTTEGDARAYTGIYSSSGLVQAGYILHAGDSIGSAYAVKYDTLVSPCQVVISNVTSTDQLTTGNFSDSLGTDVADITCQVNAASFQVASTLPDQFVFCGIVSSGELNTDNNFLIYPNPSNGSFIVHAADVNTLPADVKVFDMQGRLVGNKILTENGQSFKFLDLTDGLYNLLIDSDKFRIAKKLLISK